MNLRNKKTGKLYEWCSIMVKKNRKSVKLIVAEKEDCKFTVEDNGEIYYYESFEKMCEEWETVEVPQPKEPLIKDEKIRKAVRAWAEANEATIIQCYQNTRACDFSYENLELDIYANIAFIGDDIIDKSYNNKHYTIAELCGEEE